MVMCKYWFEGIMRRVQISLMICANGHGREYSVEMLLAKAH